MAVGFGYDFTPAIGLNVTYSHVFGRKPKFVAFKGTQGYVEHFMRTLTKVASINTFMDGLTFKFNV